MKEMVTRIRSAFSEHDMKKINELEDKSLETMRTDTQEKKVKKTEHSTQELWDNIRWSNTHLIDYLGGKEGKTWTEEIFESIM